MSAPRFLSLAVAGAFALTATAALAMGSKPKADDEAANLRIQPVAKIALAAGGGAAPGSRTGEQLYQSACNGCHAAGALGAPKLGANGDWAPRLGKGLDGLLKSAVNGIRSMPAKGGVADATDAELARAIVYMANKSGGSLKDPK
jgi:cytochrome c5